MLKKAIIFIWLFSIHPCIQAGGYQHSEKTIHKAAKVWPDNEIELEPLIVSPASEFFSPYDTLFRLVSEASTLGYLVLSAAKGRFELFDFMMVYTLDIEIADMRILVYRSEYGSQVSSKSWLKQFYEIPSGKVLQYGSDVDALSGATFSARSLTEQVNRLNKLMQENPGKK